MTAAFRDGGTGTGDLASIDASGSCPSSTGSICDHAVRGPCLCVTPAARCLALGCGLRGAGDRTNLPSRVAGEAGPTCGGLPSRTCLASTTAVPARCGASESNGRGLALGTDQPHHLGPLSAPLEQHATADDPGVAVDQPVGQAGLLHGAREAYVYRSRAGRSTVGPPFGVPVGACGVPPPAGPVRRCLLTHV